MKIDLLITNCLLTAPDGEVSIVSGFVAISGSRILQTGPMAECPAAGTATVLDGQGQLALPGLVNGHCHAPMTLFRGMADDLSLSTWLHAHIFPAEARHVRPEMVYWCAKLAAAEMLLGGISTVADGYFFEDQVARACAETGIRCVAAQAVIDFPAPGAENPARNLDVAKQFLDQWQGRHPLITPAIFAHSPYTCTNETLRGAKALATQYQAPFFIHAAETEQEIHQIIEPLAPTPIRHLDGLGLLDRETVCVHCVWAENEDLDIMAARGNGVVTCPQSNLKLASGRAPIVAMLQRGIRVALGTDSAASNNSLDLFREMDLAAKVQKVCPNDPVAVPARQILAMATHGGAEAIGFGQAHGRLAPGSPADLILIDAWQSHLQPFQSTSLLVYSGSGGDVRTVIVNGQLVVHNREILTIDLKETLQRVRLLAEGVKG